MLLHLIIAFIRVVFNSVEFQVEVILWFFASLATTGRRSLVSTRSRQQRVLPVIRLVFFLEAKLAIVADQDVQSEVVLASSSQLVSARVVGSLVG